MGDRAVESEGVRPARRLWDTAELRAAVIAYRRMLDAQEEGRAVNKKEIFTELLAGPLTGRNAGAIGRRMGNISHVLEELGRHRIKGFPPQQNVGSNVTKKIVELLGSIDQELNNEFQPTANIDELNKSVAMLLRQHFPIRPSGTAKPTFVNIVRQTPLRDPRVRAWVLSNANGFCEGCSQPAPFKDEDGLSFLEVHHVRFLSEGGADQDTNAVALCPNCHRRCHHGIDRVEFTTKLYERIPRLVANAKIDDEGLGEFI